MTGHIHISLMEITVTGWVHLHTFKGDHCDSFSTFTNFIEDPSESLVDIHTC